MNHIEPFNYNKEFGTELYKKCSDYINSLPLPDKWKKILGDLSFAKSNPSFYIHYPCLFLDEGIDHDSLIDNLCIAGYLYYQSIIYLDRILDKDIPLQQAFPISNICDEESIRLLSTFFKKDSAFWKQWYIRKTEYLKSYVDDFIDHPTMDYDEFVEHADNKSALGKVAIDALYALGRFPSFDYYEKCLLLHKYYYSAFQILDDILDVREDMKKGQFNIAIYMVKKMVESGRANLDTISSAEEVAKHVHLSGISNELYEKANEYVSKAISLSEGLCLPYMMAESIRLSNTIVTHYLSVNGYIKIIKAECESALFKKKRNNLKSSVEDGLSYILNKQMMDGHWEEICNNAGVSDVWATSFIASFLNEIDSFKGKKETIGKAIDFLLSVNNGSGWGYNRYWIPDSDSTNFALLAISSYYNTACEEMAHVEHFDKESGGVSTYYDKKSLISSLSNKNLVKDVDGWLQPHPCVSAVSFYLLARNNYIGTEMTALVNYIRSIIRSNSNLAYWWVDDIYSIFFIAKANEYLKDKEITKFLLLAAESKIQCYRDRVMEMSPFNLGLLLLTICTIKDSMLNMDYQDLSVSIVKELLSTQNNDGSWDASNAMCLPAVDCMTSNGSREWKVSSYGVNVRAKEFNRLYSSVVVCSALAAYGKSC